MKRLLPFIAAFIICMQSFAQADSLNQAVVEKWAKHYVTKKAGIAIGIGKGFHTGSLDDHFTGPLLVSSDINYQRNSILYQLEGALQFTRSRREMNFNNKVWPDDKGGGGFLFALNSGYALIDRSVTKLFPYGGIGISALYPFGRDDNYHEGTGVPVYNLGFYTMINLFNEQKRAERPRGGYNWLRIGLRRQASIGQPKFHNYLSGSTYFVSVALAVL